MAGEVNRHVYLPFGGGATKCIGEHLALAEPNPPSANVRLVLVPRRLPVVVRER